MKGCGNVSSMIRMLCNGQSRKKYMKKMLQNCELGRKHPEIIIYLFKQFLDTNKHRFVSSLKNRHKYFDNQDTSMVESAHYRLKKNLFGCVDTKNTVFEAVKEYFMSDIRKIKGVFEKSLR